MVKTAKRNITMPEHAIMAHLDAFLDHIDVAKKAQPIKESVPLIIQYYDQLPLPSASVARGRRQRLSILRNRAIVHTLFATGLRAQELASLRRADCDDGQGAKMLITGKGEKERL